MIKIKNKSSGFTLIEVLIGTTLFVIIGSAVYFSYSNIIDIVVASQLNSTGLTVIDNELEIIKNIPYEDVGTIGGSPSGILQPQKSVTFNGVPFILDTTVRNIDDPFDGTIGGSPNDTAPADYKLVELQLSCLECPRFLPAKVTTTISPLNLENSTGNGALFINIFDASGQPIPNANVSVTNTAVVPNINISDVTNNLGQFQLVDIATSSINYRIFVSKNGYSSDRTYKPGEVANPNPVKPDSTVAQGQVTGVSFAIDKVSSINLKTQDRFCTAIPSVDFNLKGSKLIGTGPDIFKYNQDLSTDTQGVKNISNIEWDSYSLLNIDPAFSISGTNAPSSLIVNPNSSYSYVWNLEPKNQSGLLVTVQKLSGELINGASINLTGPSVNITEESKKFKISETQWSSGQFDSKSPNMEINNPLGQIHLLDSGSGYASQSDEYLISGSFDLGTSSTSFSKLIFNPNSQPIESGPDSLKIQIATNNDNSTWNFIGPDGTNSSFYTSSGVNLSASHNGNRYLRYKIILRTQDESFTPTLDDLSISVSSGCLSSGQFFFNGLTNGSYTLNISKPGYQNLSVPVQLNQSWLEYRATLVP